MNENQTDTLEDLLADPDHTDRLYPLSDDPDYPWPETLSYRRAYSLAGVWAVYLNGTYVGQVQRSESEWLAWTPTPAHVEPQSFSDRASAARWLGTR